MKYRFLLMAALMIGSSLFISSCEDGFLSVSRGEGSVSEGGSTEPEATDPGPVNVYGYITALDLIDSTGVVVGTTTEVIPEPPTFLTYFADKDTVSMSIWSGSGLTPAYAKDIVTPKAEFQFDSIANKWNQLSEVKWADDVNYHGYVAAYPFIKGDKVDFAAYNYNVADGDLLWARGTGIRPVSVPMDLRFNHIVSRIEAVMEFGTEYGSSKPAIVSVEIRGYDNAMLDFYNQKITTSSNDDDKTYMPLVLDQKMNPTTGEVTPYDPELSLGSSIAVYGATVIPQKLTAIRVQLGKKVTEGEGDSAVTTLVPEGEPMTFAIPTLDVVSAKVYRVRLKVGHDNAILDGVYDGTDWDDDIVDGGLLQQGEGYKK